MSQKSDSDLVVRSLRGDAAAFVALVRRYEGPLAALVRRLVADAHYGEDVLQETLLQAWRSLGQLRDPKRVKPWLLQVARNRCRDLSRSSQRVARPADVDVIEAYVNRRGRAVAMKCRLRQEAQDVLRHLAAGERELLEMFYLEGLTIRQIAHRTARPQGTVKRQLFQARRKARRAAEPVRQGKECER